MRMYDLIKKKRDGGELSDNEIRFIVNGYVAGDIADYQISAFLMAVYFRGMSEAETLSLTLAIASSGDKVDLSSIKGVKVDKHSSGGVGDKTTLIISPIVASCGVKVAKMSGRGLGHTGGTLDKLESICGYKTQITQDEFVRLVNENGIAVIGQSGALAPADKLLYALRDVTATVDSIPLIASSIMGKKLASGADALVLDVTVGSGAFMKNVADASELARQMVKIGNGAGVKTVAILTDMDKPTGRYIGNSLEVIEAVDFLNGRYEADLFNVCITLATYMLYVGGAGDKAYCRRLAEESISNGRALQTFKRLISAQGGDARLIDEESAFKRADIVYEVKSPRAGYVYAMDTEKYGLAALSLGAGRNKKEDAIDFASGLYLNKKTGEYVAEGETVVTLYTNDAASVATAEKLILEAMSFSTEPPEARNEIIAVIE